MFAYNETTSENCKLVKYSTPEFGGLLEINGSPSFSYSCFKIPFYFRILMVKISVMNPYCKILCSVVLCALFVQVSAQQEPVFTTYRYNQLAINPAFAGVNESIHLMAAFRKQWIGIPGAPQTSLVSFDMPVHHNWLGLGVQVYDDRIGIQTNSGIITDYAFRSHLFNSQDHFSAGILAGFSNIRADYNKVDLIQSYDPAFSGIVVNALLPVAGAGIFYQSDHFYIGFSAPNLVNSIVKGKSVVVRNALSSKLNIHYFLTAGYTIDLSENVLFRPSFLWKLAGAGSSVDLTADFLLMDVVTAGLTYNTANAFAITTAVDVSPVFKIGYCYDRDFSWMGKLQTGIHGLFIKYSLQHTDREKQFEDHKAMLF
jgi:type IX secretion system PorP/SprF family membrane protein